MKSVKLKGVVHLEKNGIKTFSSKMHDGTEFKVQVISDNDIELNDDLNHENSFVDGWLMVIQEAQQDTRCYLTLPSPSLVHGRQVVVQDWQLMPRSATLDDFKPRKQGKSTSSSI